MPVTLDLMEYANDAAAQAAYPTSDAEGVEESFETGRDINDLVGDSGGTEIWRACKFTTSVDIVCSAVSTYLETHLNSPVGDMTFRIETNSGANKPSGTLAHANATGIIAIASITENAWNKCAYTPFTLSAGTYWLVYSIPDQANDNGVYVSRDNDGVGQSALSLDHGSTWQLTGANANTLYFRIYAVHLQCYSESTIIEQGTYSLKGIAKITDSLNDTLTRTVDPTIDLSGEVIVHFDIRASRTGSNIKIGIRDLGTVITEITPNIVSPNTFQTVWMALGITANKDAIDRIIFTIVNADSDNIFYIDNIFADSAVLLEEKLALLESLPTLARALTPLEENLALFEDLTQYARGLPLEESLALKEEETASINSLLTESLGLLESLPTLGRALTLQESLALLEALTQEERGLTLQEAVALLESLPTLERGLTLNEALALLESETVAIASVLTENLALKEELTQLGRTLTLEESLALLEELHAYSLLCEIDKLGNIKLSGLVGSGDVYAYVDSDGKIHRGASYP